MSLEAVIAKLQAQGLEELREEWRRRYGAPPRLRSDTLLRHVLACRIQADMFGALDEETRKLLRGQQVPQGPIVPPGTLFTREWQGVRHEVEAVSDGFLYDGRRWQSLSEIAREIAGSRWNGPRFFGLRRP